MKITIIFMESDSENKILFILIMVFEWTICNKWGLTYNTGLFRNKKILIIRSKNV